MNLSNRSHEVRVTPTPARTAWMLGLGLALALAVPLLGCSDGLEPPGVEALYGAPEATQLTPFPSNRYAVADAAQPTGVRLDIGSHNTRDLVLGLPDTIDELNALDGFSVTGGVVAMFSGPLDVAGIALVPGLDTEASTLRDASAFATAESPLIVLDVDPLSPERGKARGLIVRYWAQPKDDYYIEDEFTLIAQPAEPLLPRTRYLFVVTDSLRANDGGEVHRSPMSEELLEGRATGQYAGEVALGLAELEGALGIVRERVRLATSFTTMSVVETMAGVAARARATAAPAPKDAWTVETPLGTDGRIRYRATYASPEFRAADKRWELDSERLPKPQGDVALEVFLAISDAAQKAPRPVVIFAHGLGGDKDGCWGTAERLASLGAAVFAIDSPHHGSRSDDPTHKLEAVLSFFGINAANQSFLLGRARDNFRQMASDQLELVRFIQAQATLDLLPPGAPDGIPDLDTSRILYLGHSFGSVQGATVFALAPEIRHAVWNVGGAGLTTLMRDSNTFSVLVNSLRPAGVSDGALARFFAVVQTIMDPGDPLNFARYGTLEALAGVPNWSARDVLIQEVLDDNIIPNATTEALARAAHLVLADPIRPVSGMATAKSPLSANLASQSTGVLSQFDRMDGGKVAEHGSLYFAPEGVAQYVEFFRSGLADGHATVLPAYP
ncbi:MAG: alpha/beta fold hydrolase [Myxococcales bacterium]|nr:alpha/beta fold hydrolase [Myxococcales bacterium]